MVYGRILALRRREALKNRHKKSRPCSGQLSIFAILIFQALFVLFALSLNITLSVHDKINLQNSVDIATYYGAMKQAEMLNAIAHINYQIRQSWKLMTWRYRVLGSVGITNTYAPFAQFIEREHFLPVLGPSKAPGPYFFCVGHKWWGIPINQTGGAVAIHSVDDDLLCTKMDTHINAPSIPVISGALGGLSNAIAGVQNLAQNIGTRLSHQCEVYSFNSWFLGAQVFVKYREDQSARKAMIYKLAEIMAQGKDIDGQDIEEGVRKTFEKNLTFINKESYQAGDLKQFSSLQHPSPVEPQRWIKDNPLYHLGLYSEFIGRGGCTKKLNYLQNPPREVAHDSAVIKLQRILSNTHHWPACARDQDVCGASAGLRKNLNFMIFYAVKAELDYHNQIFLPFGPGNVKLKAQAFSKPFGGTIGPNKDKDPLLPDSSRSRPTHPNQADQSRTTPNYSRYPGDRYGLRSSYVHRYWANHIKKNPRASKNTLNYTKDNFPHDRDPLVRDHNLGSTEIPERKWEIMAVSPDLFDVTYFTILPYYQWTYFPKIRGLLSMIEVRGDLGTYYDPGSDNFIDPGLLYQVGANNNFDSGSGSEDTVWQSSLLQTPIAPRKDRRPFYKIGDFNLLLTGWNPLKNKYTPTDDYSLIGQTLFAKCNVWVHSSRSGVNKTRDSKGKIATGCIYGGRMGYSVKMISKEYLEGVKRYNSHIENHFPPWL